MKDLRDLKDLTMHEGNAKPSCCSYNGIQRSRQIGHRNGAYLGEEYGVEPARSLLSIYS